VRARVRAYISLLKNAGEVYSHITADFQEIYFMFRIKINVIEYHFINARINRQQELVSFLRTVTIFTKFQAAAQ
jgi:hypothetical protein